MKKLFILVTLLVHFTNLKAQKTYDHTNIDERLNEIIQMNTLGKDPFLKPKKPTAGAKWLIGKWLAKDTWTDKNNNGIRDGKEKSEGANGLIVEFKADGTLCLGMPGMPASMKLCNMLWQWATTPEKDEHIVWVTELITQKVTIWSIGNAHSAKQFVMETDPYLKFKKGKAIIDLNKPHDRSLFVKQ
ncbi:hypothetical protein EZJ43_11465 [Pedobacter changchengzhani]|uniref:Uncharacterized protein n=1 Tax=Pedobacter changchengzhani TaxID=2529274 RepID=A0A4R5MLI2_9SPHI|nr:hypothetical protein [Pedobacter changchengzhani]TDG35959.1 hypothetical protein EZJ43_11465 [Pedobacter changchengzhani]